MARKTVGYRMDGNQIRLVIGFYATKAEAVNALSMYSAAPYDLLGGKQKFSEIFESWYADFENKPDTGTSSLRNYKWAYGACESLHEMKMCDLRPMHMQEALSKINSYARQHKMIMLFHRLYEYCLDRDYLQRDYSKSVHHTVKANNDTEKTPFSDEEIRAVWDAYPTNESYGIILMLLYSGVRVSELLNLRSEDVHLSEQYFYVRESKTASGVRAVPIADKVLPIWRKFLSKEKEYAVTTVTGNRFIYDTFLRRYWWPLLKDIGLSHTIHETRHTFITNLTMADVNHTLIKKIVGHKSSMDLTERVYTHAKIEEMIKAVNLLK